MQIFVGIYMKSVGIPCISVGVSFFCNKIILFAQIIAQFL